jgi:hypothetical protein
MQARFLLPAYFDLRYAAFMKLTLLFLFVPVSIVYAGERDLTLTAEIDYHRLFEEGGRNGFGLGGEINYGINDTFGITAQLKEAFMLTQSENLNATERFFSTGVGVSITLDVLRVVPVVTIAPSLYQFSTADGEGFSAFGAQLGLSFDYLLTRRAQIGLLAGGYQYRIDPENGADARPDSFVMGLRGSTVFSLW